MVRPLYSSLLDSQCQHMFRRRGRVCGSVTRSDPAMRQGAAIGTNGNGLAMRYPISLDPEVSRAIGAGLPGAVLTAPGLAAGDDGFFGGTAPATITLPLRKTRHFPGADT